MDIDQGQAVNDRNQDISRAPGRSASANLQFVRATRVTATCSPSVGGVQVHSPAYRAWDSALPLAASSALLAR